MRKFLLISFLFSGVIAEVAEPCYTVTDTIEIELLEPIEVQPIDENDLNGMNEIRDSVEMVCAVMTNPKIIDDIAACLEVYKDMPPVKAIAECKPEWKTMKDGIEGMCSSPLEIMALGDCLNDKLSPSDGISRSVERKMNKEFAECMKNSYNTRK